MIQINFFQKPLRVIGLFLLLFGLQIATVVQAKTLALPNLYYRNTFFTEPPANCLEIKKLVAVFRDSNNFSQINEKNLPYFQQPKNSIIEYIAYFEPARNYKFLIINYIDDNYSLAINGEKIRENVGNPWEAQIIEYSFLKGQQYFLNFLVFNALNIGGIGQILICQENPYQ